MFKKLGTLSKNISFARFFDAPHKKFFWGAASFLFGIFIASVGFSRPTFPFLLAAFLIFLTISLISRGRGFSFLAFSAFLIFSGAFYYGVFDLRSASVIIPFNEKTLVVGIVSDEPITRNDFQEARVTLSHPYKGGILLKKSPFPELQYGDEIEIEGIIRVVEDDGYGRFLKKEGIRGTISFPNISIRSNNNGSAIRRTLIEIKGYGFRGIESTLSYESAAFLKGILFGDTSEFSHNFKEAMKMSGTTHIVALSGYNITILANALLLVLLLFFSPRVSAILATLGIGAFVIMTGASPSVVRAGIMGIILIFGKRFGGEKDMKNAILFAALIMILVNPYILISDIGFQLSFFAFLGIVYIAPLGMAYFPGKEKRFSSWRDNLFSTISAQIMVLPILLSQFGVVSIISVPANLIILEFIPCTMGFGFFTMCIGMISSIGVFLPGVLLEYLLYYEMAVIEFFGLVGGLASFKFSATMSVLYYAVLFLFVRYVRRSIRVT